MSYAAADDDGEQKIYAVCDHRLDGDPLTFVIQDHFREREARIVPEVMITKPRTSFDCVVHAVGDTHDLIAIETQAIDLRGGGVGPAFKAWMEERPEDWRSYFSEEAKRKGRRHRKCRYRSH